MNLSEHMKFGLLMFYEGKQSIVWPRTIAALVRRDLVWYRNGQDSPELTEKGRREAELIVARMG